MATTQQPNIYLIIYINTINTILKIGEKILLNMENLKMKFSFNNNKGFFMYTQFIYKEFIYYVG